MAKKEIPFKVGDSVVVKQGIPCPDREEISIAGWQGRVIQVYAEEEPPMIDIRWDSITLRAMPEDYIRESEEQSLGWDEMVLEVRDVELAQPRDSEWDVNTAIKKLAALHTYDYLGEEGELISEVLKGINPSDMDACLNAWEDYLEEMLSFPFETRIAEPQEGGPLQMGDQIQVMSIHSTDDLYGVLVKVRHGRSKYVFPLCDLETIDSKSPNHDPVEVYRTWFVNR